MYCFVWLKCCATIKHIPITKENAVCRTVSKLGRIKEKLGLRMNFLLPPMTGFNFPVRTYKYN